MKFCTSCGYQLNADDRKCPCCGIEINLEPQQTSTHPQMKYPDTAIGTIESMGMNTQNDPDFERILSTDINTEETLLVDSHHAALATANGNSYQEITLCRGSDGNYYLNEYWQDFMASTVHKAYLISADAAEEVLNKVNDIVCDNNLLAWHQYLATGLCGGKKVVKFRDENNQLVRISTDQMPPDGSGVFTEIDYLLKQQLSSSKRVI